MVATFLFFSFCSLICVTERLKSFWLSLLSSQGTPFMRSTHPPLLSLAVYLKRTTCSDSPLCGRSQSHFSDQRQQPGYCRQPKTILFYFFVLSSSLEDLFENLKWCNNLRKLLFFIVTMIILVWKRPDRKCQLCLGRNLGFFATSRDFGNWGKPGNQNTSFIPSSRVKFFTVMYQIEY